MPPRPREVPRAPAPARIPRAFIVAVIVLAVLVIVGIAIFITHLGGGGPRPTPPKSPAAGMWIAPI